MLYSWHYLHLSVVQNSYQNPTIQAYPSDYIDAWRTNHVWTQLFVWLQDRTCCPQLKSRPTLID